MKPKLTDSERRALIQHLRRRTSGELPTEVRTITRNGRQFILIGVKSVTASIYAYRPDINSIRRQNRLPPTVEFEV